MSRIPSIDPANAQGTLKETLDGASKVFGGTVPNLHRTIAHSLPTLQSLVGLSGALHRGKFSPKLREQIALLTAERNGCEYCLSAHSLFGAKAGLSQADIEGAREARAGDPKAAALAFAARVIDTRGHVADADLAALRAAGFGDEAAVEIVGNVALTVFTNLLNNVAQTEVDFPAVKPAKRAGGGAP